MKKSAKELLSSNLFYIGKSKLAKMSEEKLDEIIELYNEESAGDEKPTELSKDEKISKILKMKEKRKNKADAKAVADAKPEADAVEAKPETKQAVPSTPEKPIHKLPDGDRTRLVPSGEQGVALEVTVAKQGESTRIFKKRHELRIVSFNSLKLRTGKAGLEEQWLMLIATLATFDVVVIQEVPAETAIKELEKKRAYLLKAAFEHHSGDEWNIALSEPCGPGNLEVHVALVRKPIEIIMSCTNRTACGVPIDHAPLTFKIFDDRFHSKQDKFWVISSVHFPPKTREKDRDVQITAFLKEYERESAFRLDTPFTPKGAKDAKKPTAHHLIAGEFNAYVGHYELQNYGFGEPLLGESVSTSVGGQAYDNFVISQHTASKFTFGSDVLELNMPANTSKGEDGLSDHHPIVLRVKDASNTKKSSKKAETGVLV